MNNFNSSMVWKVWLQISCLYFCWSNCIENYLTILLVVETCNINTYLKIFQRIEILIKINSLSYNTLLVKILNETNLLAVAKCYKRTYSLNVIDWQWRSEPKSFDMKVLFWHIQLDSWVLIIDWKKSKRWYTIICWTWFQKTSLLMFVFS